MDVDRSHCFVCDQLLNSFENNIRTVQTTYSSTLLYELLEKLLNEEIVEIDQCCCDECTKKLNDYDLASLTALNLEADLLEIYQRKSINYYVDDDTVLKQNAEQYEKIEMQLDYDGEEAAELKNEEVEIEYLYEEEENDEKIEKTTPTQNKKKKCESKKRKRKQQVKEENDNSVVNDDEDDEVIDAQTEKAFKCRHCDMSFDTKTERTDHMKSHRKKSPFICDICGQSYKSKTALDIHVGMHNGISPHECEVCGKKFTQKGALVRHMPLHTGEHPYQCDKCGKQFIHYSSFHMHQLAHYDIRLKKCEICGLQLRSNSHLTRHLRVHSGEKPYACPTCGQKFAQRYNMMTHYKGHQGIHRVQTKNKKCPICNAAFNKQTKLDEHMTSAHNTEMPATAVNDDTNENVTQLAKIETPIFEMIEIKCENI